jgi:hypothetical protein
MKGLMNILDVEAVNSIRSRHAGSCIVLSKLQKKRQIDIHHTREGTSFGADRGGERREYKGREEDRGA